MSYTRHNWIDPETIDAAKLNNIEDGIEEAAQSGGGGSPWDAVIRLTHAENSGEDTPANLTPSIISGTFADLYAKISDGKCPCILVEYKHSLYGQAFSVPMAYITYASNGAIVFYVAGYSTVAYAYAVYGGMVWAVDDTLVWN